MTIEIRALACADIEAVVGLSLRAWAPVFASFETVLAVDPAHQRKGIADALISYAVEQARAAGAQLVAIGTGGDPGHAPARRAYEKAGFTALPQVRYYRAL